MSRVVLYTLATALIVSNGFWIYSALNQGQSLDGCTSELTYAMKRAAVLAALVTEYPRDATLEQARAALAREHPDWIVKQRDDQRLEVQGITLEFREGRLARVIPALE